MNSDSENKLLVSRISLQKLSKYLNELPDEHKEDGIRYVFLIFKTLQENPNQRISEAKNFTRLREDTHLKVIADFFNQPKKEVKEHENKELEIEEIEARKLLIEALLARTNIFLSKPENESIRNSCQKITNLFPVILTKEEQKECEAIQYTNQKFVFFVCLSACFLQLGIILLSDQINKQSNETDFFDNGIKKLTNNIINFNTNFSLPVCFFVYALAMKYLISIESTFFFKSKLFSTEQPNNRYDKTKIGERWADLPEEKPSLQEPEEFDSTVTISVF